MAPRLLVLPLLAAACAAHAQTPTENLQKLQSSLTTGSETTLVTPLRSGMLQVTTFQPGTRLTSEQAAQMVKQARDSLRALGEPQPTAEEIARMLAGGPIELPSGRIQTAGMLRAAGWPAAIESQVVLATAPVPATSAAAGGSAATNSAREQAIRALADLGIINPSEDEIRTALIGGTINTVNGPEQLPGILTRQQP